MDDRSRRQVALLLALLVLIVCAASIAGWLTSSHLSTAEMSFEIAVMEALAEEPKNYSAFVQEVAQRRQLDKRDHWWLWNSGELDPPNASKAAVGDQRSRGAVDSPVVWREGRSTADVAQVYTIQFSGGGGCWGGGGPRGHFRIYVGHNGEIVGWFTPNAEWRAKVLEMMNSKISGGG